MDFDHVGGKVMNVSAMAVRVKSLDRVRAEAGKCEVVCANCHRLRTEKRADSGFPDDHELVSDDLRDEIVAET